MTELSENMLPLEEGMKYFPWIANVNKRFSRCFPSDYDEETLHFFHREIEKELEAISIRSTKKNEALFSSLLCFYNHFCSKTNWKKPSPHMKSSCARILSSICRVGLMLSKGNVQSKWINQVLSAVSIFPGDNDYLYDALLQIYKFNKKYYSAYAEVLRHILRDPQPKTDNPCTFFKLLLLFRRLKFLLQNPYEKARVDALAAAVAIPPNLVSWLADNDLQDVSKAMKKNKMIIMKRKFSNVLLVRLREAVLHDTSMETSPILKDNEATQFIIDCNPETVSNELLSKSLNAEEDSFVNTEADLAITKSKRKSTLEPNESNEGNSTKKRKKRSLDNKLNGKRASIKQSRKEVMHESEIPNEYIDSGLASNLDYNTPSTSKKEQEKSKAKFQQVPRKEVNEMSVDINLKEESNSPFSTNVDEIEKDSLLVQSYSSAIQSIKKGKKKRNTINIAEDFNPKDIENEASINEKDMTHVQSIKKSKKKRKTINIVEDIENSSNFGENESLNVRFAKRDQNNRTSMNVIQKPQDIENELVVNEKTASSTKKGKKRKSINISQENVLNNRDSQSESETEVSLYVQSIETGRNRRKTINFAQDTSQKDIEKDLWIVSSSKKGKKKRQTINIGEEINPKNIEYRSKFNEHYSLCAPLVTNQSDTSSTPSKTSKTNKKRKSLHFTSANFIVTPCENVDSVAAEDLNEDFTKRNSTSMKNEWIVTVNKSDLETIPLTPKTLPAKHNFKVSEINETMSEAVAIKTINKAEVEAIAERNYAEDIVTPVPLTSTTSESETTITRDEVADESISESESLEAAEKAKSTDLQKSTEVIKPIAKAVKFVEETESIVSTDETEADNTEDDDDESISETESIDPAEEAKSSESTDETEAIKTKIVEFVEETESFISTNELEAANTEDEEADEFISDTKLEDTAEEAESSDETEAIIMPITKTVMRHVDEAETIVSINEAKAFESISEMGLVDKDEEAESSDETEAIMPITEAVKFVDGTETIVSTNEAETFGSIDKPSEPNSLEETGIVETTESEEGVKVSESVEEVVTVNKTTHVASTDNTEFSEPASCTEMVETVEKEKRIEIVKNETNKSNDVGPSDETKAFKSIPVPIDEEDAKSVFTVAVVKIVEETKGIQSTIQTKAFESIPETEDKALEDVETDEDKGTEDINSFTKTEKLYSISETKEGFLNRIQAEESVEEVKLVDVVKETKTIDFNNETEDFEPIPETDEEIMEDVEIVEDTNAVNTINQTEDIGSFNKSQDFEPIPETKEVIEETEDIDCTNKTEGFESVPETEEETVKGEDIVLHSEAIEIIEETKDVYSSKKTDDFEPIPETHNESVKNVEIVEGSEAIEGIEETKSIDSTKTVEEFEPIPDTEEESEKNVETIEGSVANEIIEETKDIDSTNKIELQRVPETVEESEKNIKNVEGSETIVAETNGIDSTETVEEFEPIPETEESEKDVEAIEGSEAIEIIGETKDIDSTNIIEELEHVPEMEEESERNVETVEGSEAMVIVEETNDIVSSAKMEEFEHILKTKKETVQKINVIELVKEEESVNIVKETENIDSTNCTKHFRPIAETKERTDEYAEALEAVVDKETTCSSLEDTTTVSVDETKAIPTVYQSQTTKNGTETKTAEGMEVVYVVQDGNVIESIDETETVESVSKPEAVHIIQETDVKSSDEIEALELVKDTNSDEFTETDPGTYIKTKAVKTVQEIEVKPVKRAENLESTNKTETDDSDEILEIIDSTDRTETEDTDEYLEIIESTDDKTENEETDEKLEKFESTDKAKADNDVEKSGDMECKAETENVTEPKNVVMKKVSRKYSLENVSNSTQCSTEISESELDTSISKYNSLVKEIFCDAGSDDSVRESLSPYKIENIKKHSTESVSSQSVMSPKSTGGILENNPSLTKNCEISSLNSEIDLNSSENIADESTEIEEAAPINNTQYYCKLLLKEVTKDNFIEDSDNETVDESKNIADVELSKNILNQSSSEETTFDSRAQFEGHSSTKMDISSSKIVVETISNKEKLASKETETVESLAEGLYKKILMAKKERLSLTDSVPENTAAAILTENTVSYVIGKVIKKVEDGNNTVNDKSFEDLKKHFTPERSQLPKLGNLSNLKPFGFPDEKSECLSFVDFSKEEVSDSTEIENSELCPPTKRNDFYPYRNLITTEVPDDKSESNFSDLVVDDKLEETICVPNEEDSSDDETEIDEDVCQSPVSNTSQNETIVEEPKTNVESQSLLKTQSSPKLDSEELISLVRTMKVPVVNLGHKCDDVRFEREVSQHDKDVASSYDENEILSTETEEQIDRENIVESQTSISISQESKNKESKPEIVVSETEEVITTRKLRNRNLSSVVADKSTSKEKHLTPEKSSHTRSRRNLKSTESNSEATSTNLRRSTRRLRNEFKELRLDSPKRCNPVAEVADQKIDSDSIVNSLKSKTLITRSTRAKRNDSAVSKTESDCSNPSVEVDQETDPSKETSKISSTRKRATRSTATTTKITKFFSVQPKTELTPVNETESEDQVEDSAESSTENLPVKKRFTRSNAVSSDRLFDAKEDVKDSILGDVKSKNTVPKRSTRTTTRGASRTKLSQTTPAKEESDVEDMDTQSNVSEESHKENVAEENEDEAASKKVESSSKEYNFRRSTRNLIRPSRLKLSQDHF